MVEGPWDAASIARHSIVKDDCPPHTFLPYGSSPIPRVVLVGTPEYGEKIEAMLDRREPGVRAGERPSSTTNGQVSVAREPMGLSNYDAGRAELGDSMCDEAV